MLGLLGCLAAATDLRREIQILGQLVMLLGGRQTVISLVWKACLYKNHDADLQAGGSKS
jgi:hypothetical protein